MGTTLVASIAAAITLSAAGAALAQQPQPDPAPVPAPPPASAPVPPAPAPSVAPPPAPAPESEPRPARSKKKPARVVRRKRDAEPASPLTAHPPRAEEAATLTRASAVSGPAPAAAPAPALATAGGATLSAAETGLLLLLAGVLLLALVFAAIPGHTLAALSVRLVERRSDIGLAMALTVALAAAVFVVLVGT